MQTLTAIEEELLQVVTFWSVRELQIFLHKTDYADGKTKRATTFKVGEYISISASTILH